MRVNNSSTGKITRPLMSLDLRMMKALLLVLLIVPIKRTKDGRLSILIKQKRQQLRVSTKTLVSTSTDHSTSSLSFLTTELLRCLVEPTWSSRDGERTNDNNNSSLMKSLRPSETTTGRTTALISKAMVDQLTSEQPLASTQDGGNCSGLKMDSL